MFMHNSGEDAPFTPGESMPKTKCLCLPYPLMTIDVPWHNLRRALCLLEKREKKGVKLTNLNEMVE